jgi:hypothetical protein
MQKEPRYYTTPTCSRPVYGYLLEPGDKLEATDLYDSTVGDWAPCPAHGIVLGQGVKAVWIRPCEQPRASDDLRKLTNWAVIVSHDLCAAGLALKSHARKVRAAVVSGDIERAQRALDDLDLALSRVLGPAIRDVSGKASELTEQLREAEKV